MRGDNQQQAAMFSFLSPEQRVPTDHPLRTIHKLVDRVLLALSPEFDRLYSHTGRPRPGRTLGADKAFDTADFVETLRAMELTPHVAQHTRGRRSALDGRTTHHPGYAVSQRKRKRIEEIFGWLKTIGLLRKLRHRGLARVDWMFVFATAVYNLVRLRTLSLVTPAEMTP